MVLSKTFGTVVAATMALLFSYTGIRKLLEFSEFSSQMHNQPIAGWIIQLAIWGLPSLEILLAVLLSANRFRLVGFVLTIVTLSMFTVYISLIIAGAFSYIPCSCSGIFRDMSWEGHLYINIILTALAYIGYRTERRKNISRHDYDIPR